MRSKLKIAMVAGEASGDLLGARVIAALQSQCDELEVEGIGGPRMEALGMKSLYPMERLSVMGLVEPLKRLPELLRLRRRLYEHFIARPPDVFLGIDSPDFNLTLEGRLKAQGIRTAHLVSPSVWAWREGRIKKIAGSVDLMQCLFPFEPELYRAQGVVADFVGHPLADELEPSSDVARLRAAFDLPAQGPVLALLPGSRVAEVKSMGPLFLAVAKNLWRKGIVKAVTIPAANQTCRELLVPMLSGVPDMPVHLVDGTGDDNNAHRAISAADVVLTASGTATLEAALLQKPMVVAHRMGALSWFILSRLIRTEHVALPNILLGERKVPELLQGQATAENILNELQVLLDSPELNTGMTESFACLRANLRCDFGQRVAEGILKLANEEGQAT
jgi:lipid-A-disaccharide synthase